MAAASVVWLTFPVLPAAAACGPETSGVLVCSGTDPQVTVSATGHLAVQFVDETVTSEGVRIDTGSFPLVFPYNLSLTTSSTGPAPIFAATRPGILLQAYDLTLTNGGDVTLVTTTGTKVTTGPGNTNPAVRLVTAGAGKIAATIGDDLTTSGDNALSFFTWGNGSATVDLVRGAVTGAIFGSTGGDVTVNTAVGTSVTETSLFAGAINVTAGGQATIAQRGTISGFISASSEGGTTITIEGNVTAVAPNGTLVRAMSGADGNTVVNHVSGTLSGGGISAEATRGSATITASGGQVGTQANRTNTWGLFALTGSGNVVGGTGVEITGRTIWSEEQGIVGWNQGRNSANITIDADGDLTPGAGGGIDTVNGHGIEALISNFFSTGDITVNVNDDVTARGGASAGVWSTNSGSGSTAINIAAGTTVFGERAGVYAAPRGAGTVANAGTIVSPGTGISFAGQQTDAAGIFNNTGTLTGTDTTGAPTNLAVAAGGLGYAVINNAGLIRGRIELSERADAFTNAAAGTWRVSGANLFGDGADTLANAGAIQAFGTTSFDFGDGDDTVTNSGVFAVLDNGATAGQVAVTNFETFTNAGGRIEMRGNVDGSAGTPSNVFAIGGNYAATGSARLGLDAALGGPGSVADQLTIAGNASGTTSIIVNDTDTGPGAYNPEGIVLVTVAGATADNFVLDPSSDYYDPARGALDKGFFVYSLVQDGSVYKLTSVADGEVFEAPRLATGAGFVFEETSAGWMERQTELRGWYDANRYGAMGRDPYASATAQPSAVRSGVPGMWAKAIGSWTHRGSSADTSGIVTSGPVNTAYRQEALAFLGGLEYEREGAFSPGDVLVLGVMGGYITSDLEFRHSATRAAYEGFTAGLSSTYINGGFFWNTLWKVDFLDTSLRLPTAGISGKTDAVTYGSLSEAGYRFRWGQIFAEPSVAFAHSRTSIENLTIGGATLNFSDLENTRAGLGLRIGGALFETAEFRAEASALGRVWHEFSGRSRTTMLDVGLPLDATDSIEGTFGEAKAGLDLLAKGSGWSGFVNAGVKFNDDFRTVTARGGIRYEW